jgi:hypothetical protein
VGHRRRVYTVELYARGTAPLMRDDPWRAIQAYEDNKKIRINDPFSVEGSRLTVFFPLPTKT